MNPDFTSQSIAKFTNETMKGSMLIYRGTGFADEGYIPIAERPVFSLPQKKQGFIG